MTDELAAAARRIGEHLCDTAIRHDGLAVWMGDERTVDSGVVHRSLDGDLYGGSAGVALFLAQLASVTDDQRHREIAIEGLRHARRWCDTTRPAFSLHTGAGGVAIALDRAAVVLDSDELDSAAADLIADTSHRSPVEHDYIAGAAGSIVALLALAHRDPGLIEPAISLGARLIAQGDASPGLAWPEEPGAPALCGLGHGASGGAFALHALADVTTGDERDRFIAAADAACHYERTWFQRDHANWPDLREFTRHRFESGERPPLPAYWCHGSVGIGLVRMARHRRTPTRVDAAEATAAAMSATQFVADMLERGGVSDGSLCHGAAGAAELLIEADRTFGAPEHRELAAECLFATLDSASGDRWPIGVPGGHENPSLMLGTAGIGAVILRLIDRGQPPLGLLYDAPMRTQQVVVQLASMPDATTPDAVFAELFESVGGARLERMSARGRIVASVPPDVDIAALCEQLGDRDDVEYAELDAIDTAQEG